MKNAIGFIFLVLFSCQIKQGNKPVDSRLNSSQKNASIKEQDRLFTLEMIQEENLVRIKPPDKHGFSLPDSSAQTTVYKFGDFNADDKEDVLVSLGACGKGGCMYGLFLNQYNNYYKLAFMDYLKNAEFEIDKNLFWIIKSYEEIEPYNPSKLQVSIFKFEKDMYWYELDTTFVYQDKTEEH